MRDKKLLYFIIFLSVILLLLGILFFFNKNLSFYSSNNVTEYTPAQEFSDDEIRKTIISLYFRNIATNSLIAEAKAVDVKELYQYPYTYLINMLIAGPESEKLKKTIPEGTKVLSCTLRGNILYVDLSREFIDNCPDGITDESIAIYSIVNTLTELNEVTGVKILINGEENESFNDNKMSLKDIFTSNK